MEIGDQGNQGIQPEPNFIAPTTAAPSVSSLTRKLRWIIVGSIILNIIYFLGFTLIITMPEYTFGWEDGLITSIFLTLAIVWRFLVLKAAFCLEGTFWTQINGVNLVKFFRCWQGVNCAMIGFMFLDICVMIILYLVNKWETAVDHLYPVVGISLFVAISKIISTLVLPYRLAKLQESAAGEADISTSQA